MCDRILEQEFYGEDHSYCVSDFHYEEVCEKRDEAVRRGNKLWETLDILLADVRQETVNYAIRVLEEERTA